MGHFAVDSVGVALHLFQAPRLGARSRKQTPRVPPLYPMTRAHEVDSATRWGRHLAAAADSILVLHRALPDLQRMKLC